MSKGPDLSAFDASIPFYDRTPELRATRASLVKFVDSVGIHLICPRRACRREGGCADRDPAALPFCWEHHRDMLRFLLLVAAKRHGITIPSRPDDDEVRMPKPFRGRPLLAAWAASGVRIADLARAAEDGPDEGSWEASAAMRDLFDELTDGPERAG
jgi:hypothetical protein